MNRNQWLLLATCALSLYSVGNIWPVQLSSYRLWRYVGPREFHAYHLAWWHSIWGVILGPAVLVFVGALLMLRWRVPGVPTWAVWAGLALQLALVLGTALQRVWCAINRGERTCRFDPTRAGVYAVACFHDENGNGKLDTGLFGIPKEATAASNDAKGTMGPPKFNDAKFSFPGNDMQ